jgi:hypothetical protein
MAAIPGPAAATAARDLLHKPDHPRTIDRYIDYFGDGLQLNAGDADGCGDLFLESLA